MESKSKGIGFGGVLAIVFIILKLTGNIGWSWWWVLAPVWIPATISAAAILGLLFLAVKEKRNKS